MATYEELLARHDQSVVDSTIDPLAGATEFNLGPDPEGSYLGQVPGAFLELGTAMAALPSTTLRALSNSVTTVLPTMGEEEAVVDIPGMTRDRNVEPLKNPAYRATQSMYRSVKAGSDALMAAHPTWKADPPKSLADLRDNPGKLVKGMTRAAPLLVAAGFATATGAPSVAITIMFTAEKEAAKAEFIARDVPEAEADEAANVFALGSSALEFLQLKSGLKLFSGMRTAVVNRAAMKLAKQQPAKGITRSMAVIAVEQSVEEMGQGTWQEIVAAGLLGLEVEGGAKGFADRRAQEAIFATALSLVMGGGGVARGAADKVSTIGATDKQKSAFSNALLKRKAAIARAINDGNLDVADRLMKEAAEEAGATVAGPGPTLQEVDEMTEGTLSDRFAEMSTTAQHEELWDALNRAADVANDETATGPDRFSAREAGRRIAINLQKVDARLGKEAAAAVAQAKKDAKAGTRPVETTQTDDGTPPMGTRTVNTVADAAKVDANEAAGRPAYDGVDSARHADIDAQRKRLNLDPIPSKETTHEAELRQAAIDQKMDVNARANAQAILDDPHSIAAEEQVGMVMRMAQLETEVESLQSQKDNADPAARGELNTRQERLLAEAQVISRGMRLGSSKAGSALQATQVDITRADSLAGMRERAETTKEAPLTEEEVTAIEAEHKEIVEAKKKLREVHNVNAEKLVNDLVRTVRKRKPTKKSQADLAAKIQDVIDLLKKGCVQ